MALTLNAVFFKVENELPTGKKTGSQKKKNGVIIIIYTNSVPQRPTRASRCSLSHPNDSQLTPSFLQDTLEATQFSVCALESSRASQHTIHSSRASQWSLAHPESLTVAQVCSNTPWRPQRALQSALEHTRGYPGSPRQLQHKLEASQGSLLSSM